MAHGREKIGAEEIERAALEDLHAAARPELRERLGFEGRAVGAGALFIDGEVGWTDYGATAPAFRRRGSQGALLRHRVRFALKRGCRQIHTCTGEAVPGDPQHSYANILKAGFREDYVRANYAPPRRGQVRKRR